MKVIIVGGVAGGASCARACAVWTKAEILMVERGPYVSYANCGLPYHVGGVIEKVESPRRDRTDIPQPLRDRLPHALRSGGHCGGAQDGGIEASCHGRGHDRAL